MMRMLFKSDMNRQLTAEEFDERGVDYEVSHNENALLIDSDVYDQNEELVIELASDYDATLAMARYVSD